MGKVGKITAAQTVGVLVVLGAISGIFTFWVPLAEKTFTPLNLDQCDSLGPSVTRAYHLHNNSQRHEYLHPTVSSGCPKTFTYKLYL